jgi:bacteriocin biosynthesis cyclodehydratase domain-containing protein
MDARTLQAIRVSADQVVLKRGVHELLVSGGDAASVVDVLVEALRWASDVDDVVARSPQAYRPAVEQLLRSLRARRLVDDVAAPPGPGTDPAQWAFFGALDAAPEPAQARLRAATVTVVGRNRTSLALLRSLGHLGVGAVRAVADPVLDDPDVADGWAAGTDAGTGLPAVTAAAPDAPLGASDLAVVAGDAGLAAALLRADRRAVAAGVPCLPVWLTRDAAHLGPLVIPRETACLRCHVEYRDGRAAGTEADGGASADPAMPALAAVAGRIAAMEVLKFLTRCAPSGVVARSVVLDARTGAISTRRVFKLPRCPDCSEVARHRVPAVLAGPQIPNR